MKKLERSRELGGYEKCEDSSHSLYTGEFFRIFGFGFFRKSFDRLRSVTNLFKKHPNHMMSQKNFKNSKEVENWEGTKNVRISHILRTLVNFLVFFDFDFFGYHFTTS